MTRMRIVGMNSNRRNDEPHAMFIQTYNPREGWADQTTTSENEFKQIMKTLFPGYWSEFENSESNDAMTFFYNYGEENSNETYVFEA